MFYYINNFITLFGYDPFKHPDQNIFSNLASFKLGSGSCNGVQVNADGSVLIY
jgi:hypothetical protein